MIILAIIALIAAGLAIETWAMTLLLGVIHAEVLPAVIPAGWPVALLLVVLINGIGLKGSVNSK